MWLTALAGCEAISGEEAVDQSELPSQNPIIQAGRPVSAIAKGCGNRGSAGPRGDVSGKATFLSATLPLDPSKRISTCFFRDRERDVVIDIQI
jgi:hypothetical protein